jgi:hypothetical protein
MECLKTVPMCASHVCAVGPGASPRVLVPDQAELQSAPGHLDLDICVCFRNQVRRWQLCGPQHGQLHQALSLHSAAAVWAPLGFVKASHFSLKASQSCWLSIFQETRCKQASSSSLATYIRVRGQTLIRCPLVSRCRCFIIHQRESSQTDLFDILNSFCAGRTQALVQIASRTLNTDHSCAWGPVPCSLHRRLPCIVKTTGFHNQDIPTSKTLTP